MPLVLCDVQRSPDSALDCSGRYRLAPTAMAAHGILPTAVPFQALDDTFGCRGLRGRGEAMRWAYYAVAVDGRKFKGTNIFQISVKVAESNVAGSLIFEQYGRRVEVYRRSGDGDWRPGPGPGG